MKQIVKFNINDADYIFKKLINFYDKKIVEEWKNHVENDINEAFLKYEIVNYELNKNSYMGIVLDCKSKNNSNLFVKAVPPMLCRFKSEVETLKRLPKDITCKIYSADYDNNIIVMEKIMPGGVVEYYPNKSMYSNLFKVVSNNKITIDDYIDNNFKSFDEVVKNDYIILLNSNYEKENAIKLYEKFKTIYKSISSKNKNYLLHGDIYKNNAINSASKIKVIDPLGFKAPFIMELVPICAYEMLNNDSKSNSEIFSDFCNTFSEFCTAKDYKEALFCQLVKLYIPSIFEANDGGVRASKWLKIIRELYSEIRLED